ncbi:MAG: hypothetical protein JO071_01765 [Deltaproteobacteria bacterium]|nr:hypothetical protein [Deltaproteobacteria bacterium]
MMRSTGFPTVPQGFVLPRLTPNQPSQKFSDRIDFDTVLASTSAETQEARTTVEDS